MKKYFAIAFTIVMIFAITIPSFASNSTIYNGTIFYIPADNVADYQMGMMAYRPRFVGTIVASASGSVRDESEYYTMNYFPLPTNWYSYNGGVYFDENSFICQPVNTTAPEYSYKSVIFNDTESGYNNVLSMQLGNSGGSLDSSAPDLYFDGILGLYNNDGYSFKIYNNGEIDVYVSFKGRLFLDYGDTYEVHEYENGFVVNADMSEEASLDSLIRNDVEDFYDLDCDIYFQGTFCIIADNATDITENGYGYCYGLDMMGDPKSIVYSQGEITQQNYETVFVLDKFTKMLYAASDNATTPGITPTGNITITANGTYNVTNYATATINVPQENVTIEDTNMFSWLISVASGFLAFEIAPDFTIGGILILCVGFALIMWLLKVFLGG